MKNKATVTNSFLNGMLEHLPGYDGVKKQVEREISADDGRTYRLTFIAGYLVLAYPLTILFCYGLLKLM